MTRPVPGVVRELACLALRHDDAGRPECPADDEALMRELVEEVRRLRRRVGEEPELDAAINALREAQGPSGGYAAWPNPVRVLSYLNDLGWALVRVDPS